MLCVVMDWKPDCNWWWQSGQETERKQHIVTKTEKDCNFDKFRALSGRQHKNSEGPRVYKLFTVTVFRESVGGGGVAMTWWMYLTGDSPMKSELKEFLWDSSLSSSSFFTWNELIADGYKKMSLDSLLDDKKITSFFITKLLFALLLNSETSIVCLL